MSTEGVIVCGAGRCGTSLVMQMLNAHGRVSVAGEYPAFECSWVSIEAFDHLLYNAALDAGQAIKVTNPHLIKGIRIPEKVIYLTRAPMEHAKSQIKLLRAFGHLDGIKPSKFKHMQRQMRDILHSEAITMPVWFCQQHPSIDLLILKFEDLIRRPNESAGRILELLLPDNFSLNDMRRMADVVMYRDPHCYDGLLEIDLIKDIDDGNDQDEGGEAVTV
ncbi:MAG: sulfotransferase domain-containing protein [Pseudomonadota bacterium]